METVKRKEDLRVTPTQAWMNTVSRMGSILLYPYFINRVLYYSCVQLCLPLMFMQLDTRPPFDFVPRIFRAEAKQNGFGIERKKTILINLHLRLTKRRSVKYAPAF